MPRTVGIGKQDFAKLRESGCFYIDKTHFIKEWWEGNDDVTLITRPRRFGKTLNMSMTEQFFSIKYAGRGDLFEGLSIWSEEKYRKLQGTYPVISLSFANVKENSYSKAIRKMNLILTDLYNKNICLLKGDLLTPEEKEYYRSVRPDMDEVTASSSLHRLSDYLSRYYGKKVIILLDEYDTPMQEAYIGGFWTELAGFTRSLFNAAFKTNPYLERALMTGITRISKESIFSDLNNLTVVTTTSEQYADCFGFREEEVFAALEEYGLEEKQDEVKNWYDGFTFGQIRDIYNPWSIINYLKEKKFAAYWANTSSNSLIGTLIRQGSADLKCDFERLLNGEVLEKPIDEQIVFQHLSEDEEAVWSLLLASGYLKTDGCRMEEDLGAFWYRLSLTNMEVRFMFLAMIRRWFSKAKYSYNSFLKAFLKDDLKAMNAYMNQVAIATFSYFDTGNKPSDHTEPERFYHGFVLGLISELADRYVITSNRESGFGRYDVMLEPKDICEDGFILEFKVHDPEDEETLQDTVNNALAQIEKQNYTAVLTAKGIPDQKIRKYGFAFEGKKVLIGKKEEA